MVDNTSVWGKKTAKERYGVSRPGDVNSPEDRSQPQKLGDRANLQGPDYDNNHANDWVRGKGESAEGKPGFDKD